MDLAEQQRLKIKARCKGRMRHSDKRLSVHRRKNGLIVNYGRFQMSFRLVLVRSNE